MDKNIQIRIGEAAVMFSEIVKRLSEEKKDYQKIMDGLEQIVNEKSVRSFRLDELKWSDATVKIASTIREFNLARVMFRATGKNASDCKDSNSVKNAVELGAEISEKSTTLVYYAGCGCCGYEERLNDLKKLVYAERQLEKLVVLHYHSSLCEGLELSKLCEQREIKLSTVMLER